MKVPLEAMAPNRSILELPGFEAEGPDKSDFVRKGEPTLMTLLAMGFTIEAAARTAGVSERTARRRLKDPDYQSQIQRIRQTSVDRASRLIMSSLELAASVLVSLLFSDSDSTRLRAAESILNRAEWSITLDRQSAESAQFLLDRAHGIREAISIKTLTTQDMPDD